MPAHTQGCRSPGKHPQNWGRHHPKGPWAHTVSPALLPSTSDFTPQFHPWKCHGGAGWQHPQQDLGHSMITSHSAVSDTPRDRDTRNDNPTTLTTAQVHSSHSLRHTGPGGPPGLGFTPLAMPITLEDTGPAGSALSLSASLMGSVNQPPVIWCLVFSRCSPLVSLAASLKHSQEPGQSFSLRQGRAQVGSCS